ncbi:MAG: hypothetical protein ACAH95_12760 [Fimbriimonas sp.]
MTTLGDVWATTALIVGFSVCAWALLLCLALLFQSRTQFSKELIEAKAGKTLFTGLLITLAVGAVGVVLLSMPNGVVKLGGWIVLLALMALSFTGTAGLVALAGERVQRLDSGLSGYGALSRGAMFVVLPAVMPILGWFLYLPAVFCLGVGAGIRAIRRKEVVATNPEPLML